MRHRWWTCRCSTPCCARCRKAPTSSSSATRTNCPRSVRDRCSTTSSSRRGFRRFVSPRFTGRRRSAQSSPTRTGAAGVHVLNAALQSALNPPERHKVRVERPNGVSFCPRDKVMQTENNYDKGVFNGDIGVVAAIDPEQETFTVDFGGELVVDYFFDEPDQLTLAYATTIHKSQDQSTKPS